MSESKLSASISLDLDNQWSYMKIHGDAGWQAFPSYFDIFIPYVLDILKTLDLRITFFIVGQDAALEKNREPLSMITSRGHEVGNHSFSHESWMHLLSREKVEEEVIGAEQLIQQVTGQKTLGFRGPGFSWSADLLSILSARGYLYDASTLPTFIGPVARMYYFWTSNLTRDEKKSRKELFGSFKDGLRPIKPYYWQVGAQNKIIEIPVSTIPVIKLPFHLSYLLYLSGYSLNLMRLYLNSAIWFCKLTKTEPSFLLHPLDLIGGDQIPELAFFPGMNISSARKTRIFQEVIKTLSRHFQIINMSEYARRLSMRNNLRVVTITQ